MPTGSLSLLTYSPPLFFILVLCPSALSSETVSVGFCLSDAYWAVNRTNRALSLKQPLTVINKPCLVPSSLASNTHVTLCNMLSIYHVSRYTPDTALRTQKY